MTNTQSIETVTFTPVVTLTKRADGRYDVDFDWMDSCVETDQDAPYVQAACNAVDAWVKRQPKSFIITEA